MFLHEICRPQYKIKVMLSINLVQLLISVEDYLEFLRKLSPCKLSESVGEMLEKDLRKLAEAPDTVRRCLMRDLLSEFATRVPNDPLDLELIPTAETKVTVTWVRIDQAFQYVLRLFAFLHSIYGLI